MKANDIRLEELVHFADGALNLHGRRVVMHPMHAFAQLRREVIMAVGAHEARRILTRYGYYWGQADAAAMKRIFTWDSVLEWLKAGPHMHGLEGVVRTKVSRLDLDAPGGTLRMEVTWHGSAEAEEHLLEFGSAQQPACWMLVGYASGYASFCLGKPVVFVEQKCRATGNSVCTAEGRDLASWDSAIRAHLPYFQADDIHGKIVHLTKGLPSGTVAKPLKAFRPSHLNGAGTARMAEVRSPSFLKVLDLCSRIAAYDSSILLAGESGVGKEVLAKHIHQLSPRAKGPFVGVNCSALPESLLESELFGHRRGAFTGATDTRVGLFEQAEKGTIFLDEIGDITRKMQMRLLRVLQEREIIRVGDSAARRVDIRVIAATNQNLKKAVKEGRFREDLYYRLAVIDIEIPPLRERKEDILPLARHFVEQMSGKLKIPHLRLDATCLDPLLAYHWPGNVRELENTIERAAVLSLDGVIRAENLPSTVLLPEAPPRAAGQTLAQVERDHIRAVLDSVSGHRAKAAAILGIGPATLWRKLKQITP